MKPKDFRLSDEESVAVAACLRGLNTVVGALLGTGITLMFCGPPWAYGAIVTLVGLAVDRYEQRFYNRAKGDL